MFCYRCLFSFNRISFSIEDLLRRGAESILENLVQFLFERLPTYPQESKRTVHDVVSVLIIIGSLEVYTRFSVINLPGNNI